MTTTIILGVLAALGIAGLTVAVVMLCRTNAKMGNQLICNSDYQIRRIESENGLLAMTERKPPQPPTYPYPPQYDEPPDITVPSRG